MIGNEFFSNSGYFPCGAATDSLVMVVSFAGAFAFIVLIVGIFIGTNREVGYSNEPPEHGILRKRPLMAPSIAFVISLVLIIALIPHPMSAYHGLNEEQIHFYDENTTTFRVYDSMAYQRAIAIHVLCYLSPSETLTVRIDFLQNNTVVTTTSITMAGNSLSQAVTEEQVIQIQPGLYEVEVPGSNYYSVSLSQPLVSGFFDEVLDWESYTFLMVVISFFTILAGFCVSTETKKRFSYERIDQEPPRDGADYARKA